MTNFYRFHVKFQGLWIKSACLRPSGEWALQCTIKEQEASSMTEFDARHLRYCIAFRAAMPDTAGVPLKFILVTGPNPVPGGDWNAAEIIDGERPPMLEPVNGGMHAGR